MNALDGRGEPISISFFNDGYGTSIVVLLLASRTVPPIEPNVHGGMAGQLATLQIPSYANKSDPIATVTGTLIISSPSTRLCFFGNFILFWEFVPN